jgi:integrase
MPRDDLTHSRNPLLTPGERTLADVLALIEADRSLPPTRRRDLASAIRRFCALAGRDPAMLPARIAELRRPLADLVPGKAGLTPKTLANLRSNLLAALRGWGGAQSLAHLRGQLTPEWNALMAGIQDKRISDSLSRFSRFCSANGIAPTEVDDQVIDAFMTAVRDGTFARKPGEIHRRTTVLWNEAADTVPGWPARHLTVPSYAKPRWSTPLARFPAAFHEDVRAYLAWLRDPLADPPPPRTCRDITVESIRSAIERAASALISTGKPLDSLAGLKDLVSQEAVRAVCRFYLDRNGDKPTTQLRLMVTYLLQIARRWVMLPAEELEKVKALRQRLGKAPPGLTPKNQATLRQFDDPENEARLQLLPETLFAEAMKVDPVATRAAVKAQLALILNILLMAPMRPSNLARLHLGKHIVRHGPKVSIIAPSEETKTSEPLEFPMPGEVVAMLDIYLRRFRPVFGSPGSEFLFPSLEAECKGQSTVAHQIKTVIWRRTGIRITPHQFRHLAAKFILDRNSGAYLLVQRLLGHRNAKTTLNSYTGLNAARAAQHYDDLVLKERARMRDQSASRLRRRR